MLELSKSFVEQAMRTNNPMVGQYGNQKSNMIIHALLGVVDETYELVTADGPINMVEELGDLRWFFALFQHTTDVVLDFEKGKNDIAMVDHWMHELTSIAKRMFAYGESPEKHMQNIVHTMQSLGRTITLLVERELRAKNVTERAEAAVLNKLRARFPDKFTEAHAQDRDIAYEREVLEQTLEGIKK